MLRHEYRRARGLADLAGSRAQAESDRLVVAMVGVGDERVVPDDGEEWPEAEPLPLSREQRRAQVRARHRKGRQR